MNADIHRQLIDGSAYIDRMAKETDQLVKMIRGLVVRSIPVQGIQVSFESSSCVWDIVSYMECRDLRIECWLVESYGRTSGYSSTGQYGGYRKTAQRVYESLPQFVEGMLKTFPELAEDLRPFIDASKVF